MARVSPANGDELDRFGDLFAGIEANGDIVPNSMRTMARLPEVLEAYATLTAAVHRDGRVPAQLKRMVAHVASQAAGCRYCALHNARRAVRLGLEAEKLEHVWEFEQREEFSDAERAALRLAVAAAQVPNCVVDDDIDALREHFDDDAIVELVAVIAMAGFTNRWNDTLATDFEAETTAFGAGLLAGTDAHPGRSG